MYIQFYILCPEGRDLRFAFHFYFELEFTWNQKNHVTAKIVKSSHIDVNYSKWIIGTEII